MYRGPVPQRYLALDYESESINKEIEHCCEMMKNSLNNPEIALSYSPRYREYFIFVLDRGKTKGPVNALQGLVYCPWCTKELPKSVRDEWFNMLEQEYDLDDPDSKEQEFLIPKEFKTDEWWIKRNL